MINTIISLGLTKVLKEIRPLVAKRRPKSPDDVAPGSVKEANSVANGPAAAVPDQKWATPVPDLSPKVTMGPGAPVTAGE